MWKAADSVAPAFTTTVTNTTAILSPRFALRVTNFGEIVDDASAYGAPPVDERRWVLLQPRYLCGG
ncbi:hypothetical protein KCP77_17815 [Salmonella enterica subsp. enterica]|nr:hypothetical protein KCP77_17815 [Salmonella enterica subsp. enterica]